MAKAFAIRIRVFVKEQGVPEDIEVDSDDRRAIHFLALASERAVGTARLVMRRRAAKIGRMAVIQSYRWRGVGSKLLQHAVATARKRGARKIYLHAQVAVIRFYEKLHFRCVGPVFDEAGIPHRKMTYPAKRELDGNMSRIKVKKAVIAVRGLDEISQKESLSIRHPRNRELSRKS